MYDVCGMIQLTIRGGKQCFYTQNGCVMFIHNHTHGVYRIWHCDDIVLALTVRVREVFIDISLPPRFDCHGDKVTTKFDCRLCTCRWI